MPRITWDNVGERYFETGVSRGVLYVGLDDGVAWNGLTSIEESPEGGEAKPYYFDGVKYLNVASNEEFAATLEAYTYPDAFAPCDGTASIKRGLMAMHQPRKAFSLSYRTRVGNDLVGTDLGYKIHLVYNVLAAPTSRSNASVGDGVDPMTMSWALTTIPPSLIGYKPTAHLVIDSRKTPAKLLSYIEDILYGNDSTGGRLPSQQEIFSLFTSIGPIAQRNLATNPSGRTSTVQTIRTNLLNNPSGESTTTNWSAGGGRLSVASTAATSQYPSFAGLRFVRLTATVNTSPAAAYISQTVPTGIVPGQTYSFSMYVRPTANSTFRTGASWRDSGNVLITEDQGSVVNCAANIWTRVTGTFIAPANASAVWFLFVNMGSMVLNDFFDIDGGLVEQQKYVLPFFDGTYSPDPDFTTSWTGSANFSTSIMKAQVPTIWGSTDPANGKFLYYSPTRDRVGVMNYNTAQWFINAPWQRPILDKWTYLVKTDMVGPGSVRVLPYFYGNTSYIGQEKYVSEGGIKEVRVSHDAKDGQPTSNAIIRVDSMTPDQVIFISVLIGDQLWPTGDYFDGSTISTDDSVYAWEGTPDASTSIVNTWN